MKTEKQIDKITLSKIIKLAYGDASIVERIGISFKMLFSKEIKNLYSVRSKAVHGSKIKKLGDSVSESATVLLKLLKKCAEKNEIPKIDLLAP